MLYAVTSQGARVGSVEKLRSGSRRWLATSAITNETARFATRREASAWLIARYLEQREREAKG